MFFSYYQDKPFARVSSLKKIQAPQLVTPNPTITKSYDIPLAREYPSDHTIDLDSYVAERFPKSLLKYFSDTGAELFAHFGTCEEALTLHQKGGFQEIHQFLGSKDGDDYPFYIMRNLNGNQSTRFVACNLAGADATRRIFQLIGPAFKHEKAHVIEHTRPAPLFKFTQKGNNLQLSPKR